MDAPTSEISTDSISPKTVVVGIGASAGGLEALRELIEHLPLVENYCYVIAQHVSPTHVSMLVGLLSPLTSLKVEELIDQKPLEPGTIFITPPNKDVLVADGVFRLLPPVSSIGPKPSVTRFFESLAKECPENSVAIILSGTGSDGAVGMRAVKASGGITIAQEPSSAKYDSMPKSAIHTGSVDLVLAPKQIGPVLQRLILGKPDDWELTEDDVTVDTFTQILNQVRIHTYFKLSDYKPATVKRRIARRMNIVGVATLQDYLNYLKTNKEESLLLLQDNLIGVTTFFRDDAAFSALAIQIGKMVAGAADKNIIRCWIAGCSTGEEVYSISMLFEHHIAREQKENLQYVIFASDLDEDALKQAREGEYPLSELQNIPSNFRELYLDVVGDHFRMTKAIRNKIVFTKQNVIEDPPFGRMDLISCRNLLIYLNSTIQKRILEVFHYALNPGGYLFLGKSESVDQHDELFESIDRRNRLYKRLDGTGHYSLPAARRLTNFNKQEETNTSYRSNTSIDALSMKVLEKLVDRYAPASIVINEEDFIIHFQGDLKPYLKFPKGRLDMNLFELVDPELKSDLRAMVYSCRRKEEEVQGAPRQLIIDGESVMVSPVVCPLENVKKHLLISFWANESLMGHILPSIALDERESLIIGELERELANTRANLNVVVEELEASNEELQSLNEELQSTNEELQSTNEELQTSNEELQSTNEELLTVNEELQVKSIELETTASDLINVKESLAFPLMVVDTLLKVTQINAACHEIIYQPSVVEGGSLNSVQWQIEVPGLNQRVKKVLNGGPIDKLLVTSAEHAVYSLQIMPYRHRQKEITGAVLVFENITAQFKIENALKQSEERFRLMMSCVKDYAVIFLDKEGCVTSWNEGAQRIKGYTENEILGRSLSVFYTPEDLGINLPEQLLEAARAQGQVENEGWRIKKNGQRFFADVILTAVKNDAGELLGFAKITRDITQRRQTEDALKASENRFRQVTESLPQLIWTCTPDGYCDYLSPQWVNYTGVCEEDQLGFRWLEQLHPEDRDRVIDEWNRTAVKGDDFNIEFRIRRYDGAFRWFQTLAVALKDANKLVIKWYGSNTDIDDLKRAQQHLEQSGARVGRIIDVMPEAVLVVDEAGVIRQANKRSEEIFGYPTELLQNRQIEMLLPSKIRQAHGHLRNGFNANPTTRTMGVGRDLMALHMDGHEFPVEVALAPFTDGERKYTVASIADISHRKEIEEELRLAANVFASTLDGILIANKDLTVLKVNQAFERIMGYTQADIQGLSLRVLQSDKHEQSFYEEIWATVASTGAWQGEAWERHKEGKVIPVWINISTLHDTSGHPERYIVTLYDISEQKLSQERIHYLAHYDLLTELPNRMLFMDRFSHALNKAQINQERMALMFIDLDDFKRVNDTLGHPAGDALLCQVAERLRTTIKETDVVGRLSGDEFLILLENSQNETNVRRAAQRIIRALSEPFDLGSGDLFISASIGIACYPEDGKDSHTLLKHADLAMYRAKEMGNNLFHFYNREMSALVLERMDLQAELRRALENQELELHYQPIIDLKNRRCVGAEALIRWNHQERGWIPPIKFIPLAEENSLILVLGEWVLREACKQMKSWKDHQLDLDFMTVNVSGKQIMQSDFVLLTKDVLAETGCPAEHVTLELTESFVMNESQVAKARLAGLRALGVGIAIDDFGTGYSSLSYLKRLPITKLKLDQSFVQDIPQDGNDVAIARAILKLGEAVGLEVVAEGVETMEQMQFLIDEGCSYCQGYYYAKPMTATQFMNYLKTLQL
ncbi:EAL domain-containing protein [Leeia sp. TBRC 13508]|uniref:protein-glutamate O-methyltransferase n=1 Tax=Leeia speluncae TaxID=2884804 RepID=A0ABS8D4E9_9NEIS|nr:EAL domain-containing protein [Leeia speluncae]MCB6183089.1 EAL domain-containing protein [Leeia speluncae]